MFGKYFLRVKHMFVDDKIVLMVFAAAGGGGREIPICRVASSLPPRHACFFCTIERNMSPTVLQ